MCPKPESFRKRLQTSTMYLVSLFHLEICKLISVCKFFQVRENMDIIMHIHLYLKTCVKLVWSHKVPFTKNWSFYFDEGVLNSLSLVVGLVVYVLFNVCLWQNKKKTTLCWSPKLHFWNCNGLWNKNLESVTPYVKAALKYEQWKQ